MEPDDGNHLYKYSLSSKTKSKVSDLVQNKSSVKVNLFVDESGIYFTNCVFNEYSEESNLYKLDIDNNKVVLVAENIDDIIGSYNGNIYGIFNNKKTEIIYKINSHNSEKNELLNNDEFIDSAYIQGGYLLCVIKDILNEESDKVYIINLNNDKVIETVTLHN